MLKKYRDEIGCRVGRRGKEREVRKWMVKQEREKSRKKRDGIQGRGKSGKKRDGSQGKGKSDR